MWAHRYFLQVKSLREMDTLVKELEKRLASVGISNRSDSNRVRWTAAEKSIILKAVIAGRFFVVVCLNAFKYFSYAMRLL